jgi:hypothetical protein
MIDDNNKWISKKILAIDFDGTIVKNIFPDIGELIEDAKLYINKLYDEGYDIIIWTCRDGQLLKDAITFLVDNNIKFHKVNENSDKLDFTTSNKIYFDITIDDRILGGLPPNWEWIYDLVHENAETFVNYK